MKKLGIGTMVVGILLTIVGVISKINYKGAVSMIEGEDGPTVTFVVRTASEGDEIGIIVVGVLLIVSGAILILKRAKRR